MAHQCGIVDVVLADFYCFIVIIHRICAKYNGLEMNLFRNWTDSLLFKYCCVMHKALDCHRAALKRQLRVPPSGN